MKIMIPSLVCTCKGTKTFKEVIFGPKSVISCNYYLKYLKIKMPYFSSEIASI